MNCKSYAFTLVHYKLPAAGCQAGLDTDNYHLEGITKVPTTCNYLTMIAINHFIQSSVLSLVMLAIVIQPTPALTPAHQKCSLTNTQYTETRLRPCARHRPAKVAKRREEELD
jgi:hypothetical protein